MHWLCGVLLFCWIYTVASQKLMFTIKPKSLVVRKGSPAILDCQTNIQTSDILIQWRKGYNTKWIHNYTNKPYQLLRNYSLYFPSVSSGDEDVYFCAAYHRSTKKTIYVKVPAHITLAYINSNFIQPPLPVTKREHQVATLTCISGASQPLPIVTWEKDGRPITKQNSMAQYPHPDLNATSATLQLKNVSILADTGYYRCVATNPLLPDKPKKSQQAFLIVQPKNDEPRIEIHPVNKVSPIHQPLRLDCVIVGVPPPVVYWLQNNIRIRNTSNRVVYPNGSLVIRKLTLQDNGQYSCNGTNNKGSVASSNIFLNVAYIDFSFKKSPKDQTVVNGSRLEMLCEPPNHYPRTLRYKWYKQYRTIIVGGRTSISSAGSLIITPVMKSDDGVYLCEVTNELSRQIRTSKPAYLTVNVPPYFRTKPTDQIVVLSHTLRLMCKASGFPKPMLRWYYHNMLLSNTSRLTLGADGSLVLSSVNINDAGQYKCSVENDAGKNVAIASVVVHAPPNGTIMPSDTNVVLGNNATFLCRFAGNPPPVTVWYFKRANERPLLLPGNSSRYIQSHELLKVVNVTEGDNGIFICVGENIVGVKNFSAKLMVLVPARLVEPPVSTTVNESNVAELTCGGYGNPEPKVTWSMNGSVLTNSSRITVIGGNLYIRNVLRSDTGWYSCTVQNYLRSQTSSAILTVQVSPTIQRVFGPSRVQWKKNFSLSCQFDGVPNPQITWLKDVHKIAYTERIHGVGNLLYITSARHNDTGNYTCEASNIVGSTRMTRQLIVEVPPNQPINVKLAKITSTSIQIFWQSGFDGYSPITSYKLEIRTNSSHVWNTISDEIKSENYTVMNLKPYTLYHLRVLAENIIGWSEPSQSVGNRTSEDFPSSPTKLYCRTLNSSTIFLTWKEPLQLNGKLRKYRIQYGNHGNHTLTHVTIDPMRYYIRALKPFTWFKFRVQAATGGHSLLWGNYSSNVSCQSGEAAPKVAPKNLSLTASGSQTIMARWQKIPIGYENGIVKGYYVQYKKNSEATYRKIFVIGNDTLEHNISGLDPWTVYVVQVTAKTVALGPWSTARMSRTLESAPSGRPSNIMVKAITSSSLAVSWSPPPLEGQNGIILGYTVIYGMADSQKTTGNLTTNKTNVEISGLMIYTSYMVKVRAFTAVGFGPYSDAVMNRTLESYPSSITSLTHKIANDSVLVSWQPPHTPNGIITAYTTYLNTTAVCTFRRPGTNITLYNVTTQTREITSHVTKIVISGYYGNVTYSLCVAARTSVGYGPCSDNIVFSTNFTKKLKSEEEEFTSSIIDDHLPLIAAGAAILFVFLIGVLVCCFIRRRNKKKDEKEVKQTFNFQRHTFRMGSFAGDDSSMASHGSKPINAYSVESNSIHSQTNRSSALASQSEGHDGSPMVRLRNSSLVLGSDSSSYDAPYSTVAEIGVDPATVTSDPLYTAPHSAGNNPHHFVNALYKERELEDTRGETGSFDSHTEINPIYEPAYPQEPRPQSVTSSDENLQGGVEPFSRGGDYPALHTYDVLILPPPPPEYSDYSEDTDETPHAYSNAVTDF